MNKTRSGLDNFPAWCPVHVVTDGVFEVQIFRGNYAWVVATYVLNEEHTMHGLVRSRELIRVVYPQSEEEALSLSCLSEEQP